MFKYFSNYLKNADFIEEPCQSCGSTDECLAGINFDRGSDLESVCIHCLRTGKVTVDIPDYTVNNLINRVQAANPDITDLEIAKVVAGPVDELSKTPPVPWIQFNDWPACCRDFMRYIGEWEHNDFNAKSESGDGKEFFVAILQCADKVGDIDGLWENIGDWTAIFVFECLCCSKLTAIDQSY